MPRKFGIRVLLVLVATGALLTFVAARLRNDELRRRAVASDVYSGESAGHWAFASYKQHSKELPVPVTRRLGAWLAGEGPTIPMLFVDFQPETSADEIREVVRLFPEIESVDMQHRVAEPESIAALAALEHLKHLQINDGQISLDSMHAIGALPQSPEVSFQNILLDDDFLTSAADSGIHLHYVYSPMSSVTDAGLEAVARLPTLTSLLLKRCPITDGGLAALHGHPALRHVQLDDCPITDAAVEHLATLPDLQQLSLSGTQVTDDGIAKLSQAPLLWQLHLKRTRVTSAGLRALVQSPMLKELALDQTGVGDAEMAILADMAKIETVSLAGTKVADQGMAILASARMSKLSVRDTRVTQAGVALLSPSCKVEE
jgi:hypothetical protein